jgi:hypothetical protein
MDRDGVSAWNGPLTCVLPLAAPFPQSQVSHLRSPFHEIVYSDLGIPFLGPTYLIPLLLWFLDPSSDLFLFLI